MSLRNLTLFACGAFTILGFCAQPAHATPLTATLTWVVGGPASVSSNPSSDYGTVTLDGPDANGDLLLTVDVQGVAGKFRDLMLSFNAGGITWVSSQDGQASLSLNGFSESPYAGLFDIGGTALGRHWHSTGSLYTTLLSGNGDLTLDMFDVEDSLNHLNIYMHLQELATGGSLKVGGVWEDGGSPLQENPEPATTALLASGLIALVWVLRRRPAS